MRFPAGTSIRVETTKWGDRPHWEFDGLYLGADGHGEWVGFPRGTHNERPGFAFDSEVDCVTLLPRDAGYAATFHAPGIWCDIYVDIATPPTWEGLVVRTVDLDLDVIRRTEVTPPAYTGSAPEGIYVDDADEFAEHQVTLGYPAEVIAGAERACAGVLAAVQDGTPPFDDATAEAWLSRLRTLVRAGSSPT